MNVTWAQEPQGNGCKQLKNWWKLLWFLWYLSHNRCEAKGFSLSLWNDVQSWMLEGKTWQDILVCCGIMLGHVVQQQQTVLITLITSNYSTEGTWMYLDGLGDILGTLMLDWTAWTVPRHSARPSTCKEEEQQRPGFWKWRSVPRKNFMLHFLSHISKRWLYVNYI